jgi:hypothetical protein
LAFEPELTWQVGESENYYGPARSVSVMDIASLREKAALCLRIASQLSWNNPRRLQLTDLADRFDRQAKEIELQNHRAQEDGIIAANAGIVSS